MTAKEAQELSIEAIKLNPSMTERIKGMEESIRDAAKSGKFSCSFDYIGDCFAVDQPFIEYFRSKGFYVGSGGSGSRSFSVYWSRNSNNKTDCFSF